MKIRERTVIEFVLLCNVCGFEREIKGNNFLLYGCYKVCMLLGGTAEELRSRLYEWLEAVAATMNPQSCFVYDVNNERVPGCYQRLFPSVSTRFRNLLTSKCTIWQHEAITAGSTCGSLVKISGGGRAITMETLIIGPFLGK